MQYEGTEEEAARYQAPYEALGPISSTTVVETRYDKLLATMGCSLDSFSCKRDYDIAIMTMSIHRYNLTATRQMFDTFSQLPTNPGLAGSVLMMEGYATNAVKAVLEKLTAVPKEERESNFLL